MRRVVAEFIVRRHGLDLSPEVVVVEAFDGYELRVLKQRCLEANFEVLAVGPESPERIVNWRCVVISGTDCRNEYQVVHFRKLFQLLPVFPGREVGGTIRSIESVKAVKV